MRVTGGDVRHFSHAQIPISDPNPSHPHTQKTPTEYCVCLKTMIRRLQKELTKSIEVAGLAYVAVNLRREAIARPQLLKKMEREPHPGPIAPSHNAPKYKTRIASYWPSISSEGSLLCVQPYNSISGPLIATSHQTLLHYTCDLPSSLNLTAAGVYSIS